MTPQVLLEKLRSLLQSMPGLEGQGPYTRDQFSWIGKANAAMRQWNAIQSATFTVATNSLVRNIDRRGNYGVALSSIYEAIEQLENSLPQGAGQAFGPGAAYDFFRSLNDLIGSAASQIFIVDPYMDAEIFDGYLYSLNPAIPVRLLANKGIANVKVAAQKHMTQTGANIELRQSSEMHDRVIFVDDDQTWVLGASIKDAAQKKPTYLAPLAPDISAYKRPIYEIIWSNATPI